MEKDEKICPRCAEAVKAAALVCKHCHHEFGGTISGVSATKSPAPSPATVAAAPMMKRRVAVGCLSIFSIIVVVAVIGSHGGSPSQQGNNTADVSSAPVAPLRVTAVELARAYSANEVAAQRTYGGQTLDVEGTVSGVVLDIVNAPVVHLEGVNQFLPVQARFDKSYGDKLADLIKGQQMTVRCTTITSVISEPMLSDCSLP